ncbi:MAG TPA: hypothetical protein VGF48_03025 [Thermoanaerobaculia bacterium]|jgi:beta-lactamase superfamily II metal-dependent hydrolase
MLFTLEALPAEEGDCLLLHWGTRDEPHVALIDGGPGLVYNNHLRPRLEEIVANLEVEQLVLELVMVSHMDSDHLVGIKKLFAQLKKEVQGKVPAEERIIRAERLWLNVFNDVLDDAIDAYYKTLPKGLQASVDGRPPEEMVEQFREQFAEEDEKKAEFNAQSIAAVLAGHGEGRTLRDDQQFLAEAQETRRINSPFSKGGKATLITLERTPKPVSIEGLEFTITGPMQAEIEALQKEFDKYIAEKGLTAEAVLAAYSDPSVKNLSSIVCLAEFGGKTILLTGDARGDLMLTGLEKRGLMEVGGKMKVDIFKVPHHGSDNNAEPELFERIVADTYVLSGDGQHGNPEREVLQWIVDARGKNAKFDLVLTYDVDHIDANRKKEWEKQQKRKKPENRRDWDHDTMSLATFFEKTKDYKYTLLTGTRKIDLGDEAVDY